MPYYKAVEVVTDAVVNYTRTLTLGKPENEKDNVLYAAEPHSITLPGII